MLVCLTYLGFFLGPAGLFAEGGAESTLGFRLVNRTLTAITRP